MKSFLLTALVAPYYVLAFNPSSKSSSSARKTALGYQGAPPLVGSGTTGTLKRKNISTVNWKDDSAFSTAAVDATQQFVQKQRRQRKSKVNRRDSSSSVPTKDLGELSVGDWITARVAVVTPGVGAFVKTEYKLNTNRGYALLPKSQMKANRDATALPVYAGQDVRVRVIAIDQAKGEIAVSMLPERVSLDDVSVGDDREGIVRAIRSYGAFVDVGCNTNGLLHVSRIVPRVVRNDVPAALSLGQAVRVRVIGKDVEKNTMEVSMLCAEMDANMDEQNGIQRRRAEV